MERPQFEQHAVRWMIRRDMPQILAIEQLAFPDPWPEDTFNKHLRRTDTIGKIVEHKDRIVGFVVYRLLRDRFDVLNLAVAEPWRRRGVATALLADLATRLTVSRRPLLVAQLSPHHNQRADHHPGPPAVDEMDQVRIVQEGESGA